MKPLLWVLSILLIWWGGLGAAAWASGGAGVHATTSANWTAEPNQTNAYFGSSVASAGDVNGDGYEDVIVGASDYDHGQVDEGSAFVFNGSAAGLATTPSWKAESNQNSAYFGQSVASAGDVNGDGYDDVIVGAASGYSNGQGRAYVYHGSAAGLSTTPSWRAESNQASAHFGYSVASAGDVNGDGYDDVIVGAYAYDHGQIDEGSAFVFYGSAAGLGTVPSWKSESNQEFADFGYSVASAGDVDGDGYDDVIVGAPGYSHGPQDAAGRAYVFHGSPGGLSATPKWTASTDRAYANFGFSVASAGDVNGDFYDDVIVAAPFDWDGQDDYEGRAYVFHGSPEGLGATPTWEAEPNQIRAFFGYSVESAGDVNGDGYDDVIVGARGYSNGQDTEGRAFVFHGSADGLGIFPSWKAESNQDNAYFGQSVASAGDVNGDGYDDVIVGAPYYDNGQTDEGRAYVYHGSTVGPNG